MSEAKLRRSIRTSIEDEGYRINPMIADALQDLIDLIIEENEQYEDEDAEYDDPED